MKKDLIPKDIENIKKRYTYTIYDGYCRSFNDLNYSCFCFYLEDLKIEEEFELLRQKIEKKYIEKSDKAEYDLNIQLLNDILSKYATIKNDAKSTFEFSDSLIKQIEGDYKNNSKNVSLTMYRNLCKDIMQSAVKEYIKCEKTLLLLIDKFKNIKV